MSSTPDADPALPADLDYRLVFESLPGMYLVLRPDFSIAAASDAYLKAIRTQRGRILGRSVFDVFPVNPSDPTASGVHNLTASLYRVVQKRAADLMAVQKYDIRLPEDEGGEFVERHLSPVNLPILDADGQIVWIIHHVEDVTEFIRLKKSEAAHHEAAQRLRASRLDSEVFARTAGLLAQRQRSVEVLREYEDRYRLLFETAGDAIFLTDEAGRLIDANRQTEALSGRSRSELLGRSVFELVAEPQRQHLQQVLQECVRSGSSKGETAFLNESGAAIDTEFSATRVKPGCLLMILRDVTERKRAELAIERHSAELAESNRELAQKNSENEMFVYSVSHDLRAPLVNLQGFSKEIAKSCDAMRGLLADPRVPSDLRDQINEVFDRKVMKSVQFIQTAVLRLGNIIDALLRLSRAGRVEYRWQWVDVKRLAAQVLASLGGTIAEKNVAVRVDEMPRAWGDSTALEQVVANLIGNALNYLDPKRPGTIEIGYLAPSEASNAPEGFTTYYVRDNGLGIAPAHHGKIFQVFQRVHPGAAKGEGIGLAIVARVMERHRGKIWVESAEGVGSTFFFSIPMPTSESTSNYPRDGN